MPSPISIAASTWTPAKLSPALWLDADDASTITASSGSVSQWNDKSGRGLHITQGTAAAQPTTGIASINGRNVLSIASDDSMSRSSVDIRSFLGETGTDLMFVSVGARTGGTNWIPWNVVGATPRVSFDFRGAWYFDVAAFSGGRLTATSTMATGVASLWSGYRSSGNMVARLNKTQAGSLSNASAVLTSTSLATLWVGRSSDNARMTGTIGEIVVVPGYSAGAFAALEAYMSAKWGV